jgi:hypothetical protein
MIIFKYRHIMKKVIQILVILIVVLIPVILTAQPHPWDGTNWGGGEGGAPVGGGAPIGGGLLILLSLAIGYGTRKIYNARKKVLD